MEKDGAREGNHWCKSKTRVKEQVTLKRKSHDFVALMLYIY